MYPSQAPARAKVLTMQWTIYLSGEIHTDWRDQIKDGSKSLDLPVIFTSAVTDHAASDAAGDVLGAETENFWRDHKSSKVNSLRTGMPHLMPVFARHWENLTSPCMLKI